jgi:hypothetical protein
MQKYRTREVGKRHVFFSSSQQMEMLKEKNTALESENKTLQQKNKELSALLKEALVVAGNKPGDRRSLRRSVRKSMRSSRMNFGNMQTLS